MKLLLLLVASFISVALSQDKPNVIDTYAGADRLLTTRWDPGAKGRHFWSSSAQDFFPLPSRYGFYLTGTWTAAQAGVSNPFRTETKAWFRLCPFTPRRTSDDFQIVARLSPGKACPGVGDVAFPACGADTPDRLKVSLYGAKEAHSNSKVDEVQTAEIEGGCSQVIFNLKEQKALYPGGLYIVISATSTNPAKVLAEVATQEWTLSVFRRDLISTWDGRQCKFGKVAPEVISECQPTAASLAECVNGIFNPSLEDCDSRIDPVRCGPDCVCKTPFVPNNLGSCTACGNSLIDFNELCDSAADLFCNATCNGCMANHVPSPTGCTLCGNGVVDPQELCDPVGDVQCASTCTCNPNFVPDHDGICTKCGNGMVDAGEFCDWGVAGQRACSTDCSSCLKPYVGRDKRDGWTGMNGICSLCGNSMLDEGEACDAADRHCEPDCSGCKPNFVENEEGLCVRCGNGYLDNGERCDSSREGCLPDCSGALPGYVVSGNKLGETTRCGNGKRDADEVCDYAQDTNCAGDCSHCKFPYFSVGHQCVRCGNGFLDVGEVCDASQPGCAPDCSACQAGFSPSADKIGSCVPHCDTCCDGLGKSEPGSASSFSCLLALLVTSFLVSLRM